MAVDGSGGSDATVLYAAHEARRRGVGLHLIHVVAMSVPITPFFPVVPPDLDPAGRQLLILAERIACRVLAPGEITTSLHHGSRVDSLVEAAGLAQLLVLGRQEGSIADRLLTGSTTAAVAARADGPVAVVPPGWAPQAEGGFVVVGLASTEGSGGLVLRALRIAADHHAALVLVHAWKIPAPYDRVVLARVDHTAWSRQAQVALERSTTDLRAAYPRVEVEVRVVQGQPAHVLEAESRGAHVLVLARRHQSLWPRGHLGGVARTLLRESACAVEVVAPDAEAEVTDLVLERAGAMER